MWGGFTLILKGQYTLESENWIMLTLSCSNGVIYQCFSSSGIKIILEYYIVYIR